jgi:hypothetical protein
MAFLLDNVVPWGRRLFEYQEMFLLTENELMNKNIISFGDGPASFNAELTKLGGHVISLDPIYQFSRSELESKIVATRDIVMEQTKKNTENFVWNKIKSLDELERLRMSAMYLFLDDFKQGLDEYRYQCHELPRKTNYEDNQFDIGLSSHFLLLYQDLGIDFHIRAMAEMLRICKEIRVFPLCDLNGKKTQLVIDVINHFKRIYDVKLLKTSYEFQKGANEMLVIKK